MRELNENEVEQVGGGAAATVWGPGLGPLITNQPGLPLDAATLNEIAAAVNALYPSEQFLHQAAQGS